MYLYEFIKSISLLGADEVPPKIKNEPETLIYDCVDRKTAEKYINKLPEKGEYFQLYAKIGDLNKLFYKDVTAQVKYLKKLESVDYLIPKESLDIELGTAVYEAIWLFDLLSALSEDKFFAVSGGFPHLMAAYIDNMYDSHPLLGYYENVPLNLRIFKAQVKFFFSKYIENVFPKKDLQTIDEDTFSFIMKRELEEYDKSSGWKTKKLGAKRNQEFENFIQQLGVLIDSEDAGLEKSTAEKNA